MKKCRHLLFCLCIAFVVIGCTPDKKEAETSPSPRARLTEDSESPRGGFWRAAPKQNPAGAKGESDKETSKLSSLGYLGGYQSAGDDRGVLKIAADKVAPGYTLFTSGHEPVALLLSSDGKQVHSWGGSFQEYFPAVPIPKGGLTRGMQYWRFATMLPNGDLFAIFEGEGLVKLDKDSRLIWGKPNRAHHDLELQPDGDLLVLTRSARTQGKDVVVVDELSFLDKDGQELAKVSILDAILDSPFREEILGKKRLRGDVLHTNSIQTLRGPPASLPKGVQPGDILVSMRNAKALAIINPETRKAVWAHRDSYYRQHYARVLDNKTLMLFDNGKERSRVLFYRWPSMKLERSIDGLPDGRPLVTKALGLAQRLQNGNVLIAESYGGRLYELTPQQELVWEYATPFRAGQNNELIAVLAHAERYSPEYASAVVKP